MWTLKRWWYKRTNFHYLITVGHLQHHVHQQLQLGQSAVAQPACHSYDWRCSQWHVGLHLYYFVVDYPSLEWDTDHAKTDGACCGNISKFSTITVPGLVTFVVDNWNSGPTSSGAPFSHSDLPSWYKKPKNGCHCSTHNKYWYCLLPINLLLD